MDDRNLQKLKRHLQDEDAQNRILKNIKRARSEITITIGHAARLFGFTENQLRDWEARGLVHPKKSAGGQRLYPIAELDRLAIIRELLNAKFSPGDIPGDINRIWNTLNLHKEPETSFPATGRGHMPVDLRVDQNDRNVFWQYFVSQVLRLLLLFICEAVTDTIVGLVLPLQPNERTEVNDPKDLGMVGPSLVGWYRPGQPFQAFLDPTPSFEVPSDFRIERLKAPEGQIYSLTPYLVLQRKARPLTVSLYLRELIFRFLQFLLSYSSDWQPCFTQGMRDWVYQVTDFSRGSYVTDTVLDGIVNMVVELGGKMPDGAQRWHFCNLFLPEDDSLPVQQQKLSVRAHSKDSPARTILMTVSTAEPGLTFRAYQSGHIVHRCTISARDHILAYQDTEMETRSAIAVPVGGEQGMAVGVLYIASKQEKAFGEADLPALRVIARMVEELLPTYWARQQFKGRLSDLINYPHVIDLAFRDFKSEDDFINDVEELLTTIQSRGDIQAEKRPDPAIKPEEVVSFIEVDIDNQAELAKKYGDLVARNLSRDVGLRILGLLRLQSNPGYKRVYHINADRYYMMFPGMPLNEALKLAETLREDLAAEYSIDAQRVVVGRPLSHKDLLVLQNVTVRLGVQSFQYAKLKDLLGRQPADAVAEVRALIVNHADEFLKAGQAEGGNCIIAWRYDTWTFGRWSPVEAST